MLAHLLSHLWHLLALLAGCAVVMAGMHICLNYYDKGERIFWWLALELLFWWTYFANTHHIQW